MNSNKFQGDIKAYLLADVYMYILGPEWGKEYEGRGDDSVFPSDAREEAKDADGEQ